MHEMGIVTHLAKTLDELAVEKHISKYGSVTLQVGEVSGIITDLFVDCWNYFRVKHPLLKECELKLESTPAVTICGDCNKTYSTIKYGKECPYCHGGNTWLVAGNECVIKEVEAETEQEQ
ncbi:MAG: hydrogenase maturation nickel metallochaperone HypA [Solobacterium sp.]|jgi:hydrogenase nickel incorporation protein HypA/HybF|nr:hydrogenase maturation nickel metallochaperone HypA [Solobacterium sp.]MCH4205707.1 hydrogenase maturation nickel metallochaperone HypA [Solobacterium sp.]MCH4227231.1 hydrogenase maturation nickel metallochaperone HypA [Solobacterium sp.]MCH4282537.1 hydrogenase maturation nickel metallochaperone HypA [Solobacterium sp.]